MISYARINGCSYSNTLKWGLRLKFFKSFSGCVINRCVKNKGVFFQIK